MSDPREQIINVLQNPKGKASISMQKEAVYAKAIEDAFKKFSLTAKDMTGAMDKSFTGMQGKASAVQAIIGAAVDLMSIGISKTQKQVGAIAKQFSQGDFAGAIQGIIDMKTQFLDFGRLNLPFITAFKPINDMFSVIAGTATQTLATSDAFQDLIAKFSDPVFMSKLGELGLKFGNLAASIIEKVDFDKLFKAIEDIISLIQVLTGTVPGGTTAGAIPGMAGTGFGPDTPEPPGKPTFGGGGISTSSGPPATVINIQSAGIITDSQLQRAMNQVSRDASMWRF
jgi:hypothetical protein